MIRIDPVLDRQTQDNLWDAYYMNMMKDVFYEGGPEVTRYFIDL